MIEFGNSNYTDEELHAEFVALFPHGWCGADVMTELAPNGWANSPLAAVFHPTAEQIHEETITMRRNLAQLGRRKEASPAPPEPSLEEFAANFEPAAVEPEREIQELVGRCLWDVFCDNHEVSDADGRQLDLGSMRTGGGFLAEVLNQQDGPKPLERPEPPEYLEKMMTGDAAQDPRAAAMMADLIKEMVGDGGYTYLDFYMGTSVASGRADLQPVYEMIFRRLKARGLNWKYTFPRLYAVDLRPLKKHLDEQKKGDEPEWESYDPSVAFEDEQEETEKDKELAELREQLDDGHREAVEAAQDRPPPATVLGYEAVYGEYPEGWPPEADGEN